MFILHEIKIRFIRPCGVQIQIRYIHFTVVQIQIR